MSVIVAGHEPPLDPVARRLRPCRQCRRGISAAAHGRRGLADPYRAVLQPHRLWRLERPGVRRRHDPRGGGRASRNAACSGECDGVLSGYMGAADIGDAILDAVATVKRANPAAQILLRSGDRRRRPRHFCARRHSGLHERQGGAGRRYHHAQPVRARLSVRPRQQDAGAGARRRESIARSRAARDPGDLAAYRRDAGRLRSTCWRRTQTAASGCARRSCRWR